MDQDDLEKTITFALAVIGLLVAIIGVLLHRILAAHAYDEFIDLLIILIGGILIGGLPVQKGIQMWRRHRGGKTRQAVQLLLKSVVTPDPARAKRSEDRPKLLAMDIEGCITPAGRAEVRLDRLLRLRAYCDWARDHDYPPIIFYTGRSQGYVELLAQALGMVGWARDFPSVIENGAALYYPVSMRTVPLGTVAQQQEHRDLVHQVSEGLRKSLPRNEFEPKNYMITINPEPGEKNTRPLYHKVEDLILKQGMRDRLEVTFTASAVDITPKGVSKLGGLKEAVRRGLQQENLEGVVAVGDQVSDLDVLKEAARAYCPANADQGVQMALPPENVIADKKDIEFVLAVIERECGLRIH